MLGLRICTSRDGGDITEWAGSLSQHHMVAREHELTQSASDSATGWQSGLYTCCENGFGRFDWEEWLHSVDVLG